AVYNSTTTPPRRGRPLSRKRQRFVGPLHDGRLAHRLDRLALQLALRVRLRRRQFPQRLRLPPAARQEPVLALQPLRRLPNADPRVRHHPPARLLAPGRPGPRLRRPLLDALLLGRAGPRARLRGALPRPHFPHPAPSAHLGQRPLLVSGIGPLPAALLAVLPG